MIAILILVLSFFTCLVASEDPDAGTTVVKIGDKAPAFEYLTLDEQKISTETLEGKVVLINFFATWCPPCKAEIPHLETQIFQKIKDGQFIMVAIGREESAEKLKEFKAKMNFTFPVAADSERKIYELFATKYIPRNFVIGKDGKIKFVSIGFNEQEFTEMIGVIEKELKVE